MKHRGELLTKNELRKIANNFILTKHAKERIKERRKYINVKRTIQNSFFAYYNTDGSINIAINSYEYFVVRYSFKLNKYVVITFKEKSFNDYNIFKKRYLALCGVERR